MTAPTTAPAARPMTARQSAFIRTLLAERAGVPAAEGLRELLNGARERGGVTLAQASHTIEALLAMPKANVSTGPSRNPMPVIPAGYYAVEEGDVLGFYVIVEGEGRWEGRTFVNRFRSDETLRVTAAEAGRVRALIMAAGIEASAKRFAAELTRCYRCGRMLTTPESRAAGIGPVCAEK